MEEKSNMTAERSLEIISEQIAQTRHAVSQVTGQALYVSGLCTMGMAVVVAIVNFLSFAQYINPKLWSLGTLLWLVLPIIIKFALRNTYQRFPAPESLVGTLVKNVWWTFAVLAIAYFVVATLWNAMLFRSVQNMEAAFAHQMSIKLVIILLMGMSISMTGHILKRKWLAWFGIIGGLLAIVCDYSGVLRQVVHFCLSGFSDYPVILTVALSVSEYCLDVFLLALVGLMLPGLMLKKQSK